MHLLKSLLLVLSLAFVGIQFLFAQSLDSIAGTPDFMGYESIPILCNETSYSVTTAGSSPSADPTGFCESIENDQFICFQMANSTTVVFEFLLLSCEGNGGGIEVGVVDHNGMPIGDCIIVDDPAEEERLEITGLSPQTGYCLRVDGIQGANCDFVFTPVRGITSDAPRRPARPEVSPGPYCFGDTIGVSSVRIPEAASYVWGVTSPNVVFGQHYLDLDGNRITGPVQDSIVQLVLPDFPIRSIPGSCDTIFSYVSALNACGVSDGSPEVALVICTNVVDTLVFTVCGTDSLGVEYPVGSGIFYYVNGGEYQSAPAPGGLCTDVIAILVEEREGPAAILEVDTVVCFFPVILEGDTILREGVYSYSFPIASSECDSVVSYIVRSPSAQGAALDNPYCTNEPIRVGTSIWDNGFTYTWTDEQGELAGGTPESYLNQFENPGIYTLTIASADCEYMLDVIVLTAPEVELSIDNDSLTATATNADSIALYINGVFEVGGTSPLVYQGLSSMGDSTFVLVCALADCGRVCQSVTIDGTSSSREVQTLSQLHVWPNPSAGIFNLQLEADVASLVEVYNFIGKQLLIQDPRLNQQVDLRSQPAGIYLIILRDSVTGLPLARKQVVKQ